MGDESVEEIVLAAIVDTRGRVLVQPRAGDPALAGMWELPGGKVGPGEDHAAALVREVEEGTGVAVRVGERAVALCHAYPDRSTPICARLGGRPGRFGGRAGRPRNSTGRCRCPTPTSRSWTPWSGRSARGRPAGPLDIDSSISYK